MEHCSLILTTHFGKEKRVLMDVLDLLFPYDHDVEGRVVSPGKVCIKTTIEDVGFLSRIFSEYPIRGLKIVRVLKPIIDIKEIEKLPEKIVNYIVKDEKPLKIKKVNRRSKYISKEIYLKILRNLGKKRLLSPDGFKALLITNGDKVYLALEIFRINDDQFHYLEKN